MKSVGYVQRRCLPRTSRKKSYATSTITAFLDSLADRTPAPGGGATAALHLGQAAALVSMVARYSTGPRYAEHAAAIDGICSSADAIRERPLHFAEADMAAFSSVIDAYRMPKSTESEATERDRVIGAALTDAARVPADVLTSARAVIELADELLSVANRTVISDVAAAAEAARGAATTARVKRRSESSGYPARRRTRCVHRCSDECRCHGLPCRPDHDPSTKAAELMTKIIDGTRAGPFDSRRRRPSRGRSGRARLPAQACRGRRNRGRVDGIVCAVDRPSRPDRPESLATSSMSVPQQAPRRFAAPSSD